MAIWTSHSVKSAAKQAVEPDNGSVDDKVLMTPEGKKMAKRALERSPVIVTVTPGRRRARNASKR